MFMTLKRPFRLEQYCRGFVPIGGGRPEIPDFPVACDKESGRQSAGAQPQSRPSPAAKQENYLRVGIFEG
jgi:hypothetical protein